MHEFITESLLFCVENRMKEKINEGKEPTIKCPLLSTKTVEALRDRSEKGKVQKICDQVWRIFGTSY